MATGAVTSAASKPLTQVLRTGEKLASTADAVKDTNSKTYYHRIAGARTHMPDGLEVQFLGGVFTTNDPVVIAELDRVADKLGSGIFTRREGVQALKQLENTAATEAADTAGKAA